MSRGRRSLRRKTGIIAITGFAVIMTVVVASWERIENRFEEAGIAGKINRTDVWKDSLSIIRDFPVLGSGLGTFAKIYPKYQSRSPNVLFEHAENDYVEVLADTGILGFLTAAGLLVVFFATILKAWKNRHGGFVLAVTAGGISSCAAIAVHSLTDFNMRIPANALTLSIIAGITYATVFRVKSRTSKERNTTYKEEQEGREVQSQVV
jgi:O-antigen ligase